MADSSNHSTGEMGLVRSLGLFDITMIGVGAMIGAGIFVLTGIAAGVAGPALIIAFALNGIITVLTAMVYAELGSAIPEAGGGYLWVKEGLPGPNGFLSGWMSWFAHAVAGSLYAVGFGGFVYELLRILFLSDSSGATTIFLSHPIMLPFGLELTEAMLVQKVFAVLVILFFLFVNYRGTSEAGTVGNIVTVLKVIIILVFILSGLFVIFGDPSHFQKFSNFAPEGIIGIVSAMGLTFIAFEGYEIIVQAGEEVREPRKNIPRAVFLSLAIVVPIYMLVAFVIIGAVEPPAGEAIYQWLGGLGEIGIARAAAQFMPMGTLLIMIGGLLSTMSALNATTFSSTRVSFAMGRDRALPSGFSEVNQKTHTPHIALRWSGFLILFAAIALPIQDVAASADIMFLLLFLQVNIAVITIRSKYGKSLRYGYLLPFFPIVPIVAIGAQLLLALSLFEISPIAWIFAIFWLLAGFVVYFIYARPRQERATRTAVIQQTELTVPISEVSYRVLVPVANPDSLSTLIPPAIRAAKSHNGKIILLHVIVVPSPTPLSSAHEYVHNGDALRETAVSMVRDEGVPVEHIIRVARSVAAAIIDTVHEQRADLLIMGWRGHSKHQNTVIGSNIDEVITRVNCDLMMLQPGDTSAKRILIAVADPSQIAFSLQSAQLYAGGEDTELDVFHVFAQDSPMIERQRFERTLQRRVDGVRLHTGKAVLVTQENPDRLAAIIEAAAGYDYLVLGATRDPWWKRRIFGNTPMRIARETDTPVLLLRPEGHPVQFGLRQALSYVRGGYAQVDPESRQRLKDQGFIVENQEEPGAHLKSSVNESLMLVIGILTIIAAVFMFVGAGQLLTWVGVVAYFILLLSFTIVSTRATKSDSQLGKNP